MKFWVQATSCYNERGRFFWPFFSNFHSFDATERLFRSIFFWNKYFCNKVLLQQIFVAINFYFNKFLLKFLKIFVKHFLKVKFIFCSTRVRSTRVLTISRFSFLHSFLPSFIPSFSNGPLFIYITNSTLRLFFMNGFCSIGF